MLSHATPAEHRQTVAAEGGSPEAARDISDSLTRTERVAGADEDIVAIFRCLACRPIDAG